MSSHPSGRDVDGALNKGSNLTYNTRKGTTQLEMYCLEEDGVKGQPVPSDLSPNFKE